MSWLEHMTGQKLWPHEALINQTNTLLLLSHRVTWAHDRTKTVTSWGSYQPDKHSAVTEPWADFVDVLGQMVAGYLVASEARVHFKRNKIEIGEIVNCNQTALLWGICHHSFWWTNCFFSPLPPVMRQNRFKRIHGGGGEMLLYLQTYSLSPCPATYIQTQDHCQSSNPVCCLETVCPPEWTSLPF